MRALSTIPAGQSTIAASSPRSAGRFARVRRAAAEFPPEAVELVAQRVVQLLRQEPHPLGASQNAPGELMDAATLARHLGLNRAWVYEHAEALGAIQLSDGPRPRLRFDPAVAAQALRTRRRREQPVPVSEAARPGPPRRRQAPADVPLLPIHERRAHRAFACRGLVRGRGR